jgi:L-rhamnose mutarotase
MPQLIQVIMFKLKVINTKKEFAVEVYDGDIKIHKCGYKDYSIFNYKNNLYIVMRSDDSSGAKFRVYILSPVSDLI